MGKQKKLRRSELLNPVATPIRVMYAHTFPKDKNYRAELEAYIGMEVTITGTYDKFEVKGTEEAEETYMLIRDVKVVQSPRISGNVKQGTVNHMWIMCPFDYVIRNHYQKGDVLQCKGELYEYVKNLGNNPVRNIGLNLISSKKKKQKKEQTQTQIIVPKKKLSVNGYEQEISIQIEKCIQEQNILHFCDLMVLLHEYPVMHQIVMQNQDYFKNYIESYASKSKVPPVIETTIASEKVKVGQFTYDLSLPSDRTNYKLMLQKVVDNHMNLNASVVANEKTYIIGDGEKVIGIQDSRTKSYITTRKLNFAFDSYKFIDICQYTQSSFTYHHFTL